MKDTIVYIRTSTEDQTPELQIKDCESVAHKLSLSNYDIISDKQSAWKDNMEREGFDKITDAIKRKEVKILICWDLDRLFRNRKKLISFFGFCKLCDCKIYSARQDWLESLNKMPEPFNEMMFDMMLQIMGWLAEEESSKKSMRVKNAVRKETGTTLSYKGNKWGRRSLKQETIDWIIKARQEGKSISQICKEVYYWDKNNNKKYVSRGVVHKITLI